MATSCSARRDGSENASFDSERSISNYDLRSGQGQVMTQVGQHAYLPNRIDEPSRLAPFARLYLHSVTSYWLKTDCDLCDLIWHSREPRSSFAPGSSQMGWVAMGSSLNYVTLFWPFLHPLPLVRWGCAIPRSPPPCYANENRNVKTSTVLAFNEIMFHTLFFYIDTDHTAQFKALYHVKRNLVTLSR